MSSNEKNLTSFFSIEVITLSSSVNQALLEELRKFISTKNKHENKSLAYLVTQNENSLFSTCI